MRKGVGIGAIKNKQETNQIIKNTIGSDLNNFQMQAMKDKMEFFKKSLEEFAKNYKSQINKDPELRHHFHQMCIKIGVDPLASHKGFWSELLGVGDFYYELSIQIIQECIKTRNQNGGFMELNELLTRIKRGGKTISKDDIIQSIKTMKPLGNGFSIIKIGEKEFIQSVPFEMSNDHLQICSIASNKGYVTISELEEKLKWSEDRIKNTLDLLLLESIVWIDNQGEKITYYFPGLIDQSGSSK